MIIKLKVNKYKFNYNSFYQIITNKKKRLFLNNRNSLDKLKFKKKLI